MTTTIKLSGMTKKQKQQALSKIFKKHQFFSEAEDVLGNDYTYFDLCKKAYGDSYERDTKEVLGDDYKNAMKLAKSLKIEISEVVYFD